MERKIGEIFEYNGEWYQCVKCTVGETCADCNFKYEYKTPDECSRFFRCASYFRKSEKEDAIFKKLEKVGEPYAEGNSIVSERMFQKYRTYEKNFFLNERDLLFTSYGDIVSIEIKQNQEDMEEKTQLPKEDNPLTRLVYNYVNGKISDKELIKSIKEVSDEYPYNKNNLKPFSLEAAKAGKPVCTRDGRKARIICFDAKGDKPIIALVEMGTAETPNNYPIDGKAVSAKEASCDLMMLPEKKEGWVNIYNAGGTYYSKYIYKTEKEATGQADTIFPNHVATVKIEWYE